MLNTTMSSLFHNISATFSSILDFNSSDRTINDNNITNSSSYFSKVQETTVNPAAIRFWITMISVGIVITSCGIYCYNTQISKKEDNRKEIDDIVPYVFLVLKSLSS